MAASTNSSVLSGAEMQEHSFLWKIENFMLVAKSDKWINSQMVEFEAGTGSSKMFSKWRVYLATCSEGSKEYIGIFYRMLEGPKDQGVEDVQAEWRFLIKGKISTAGTAISQYYCNSCGRYYNGTSNNQCPTCYPANSRNLTEFIKQSGLTSISSLGNGIGFPDVIDKKDIKTFIDEDGCLNIKCTLKLVVVSLAPAKPFKMKRSLEEFHAKSTAKAKSDLEGLLHNTIPCKDVKIITGDKKEFTAQWGILTRRCEYFASMYESNLEEVKKGQINIPDVSGKTLEVLLGFLYSGTLLPSWNDDDVIVELTNAATKYGLLELEEFFDGIIGSVCNLQTAVQLLSSTQKLSLKTAEKDLLQWIKENSLYSAECFFKLLEPMEAMGISDGNYGEMKGQLDQK